MFVSLSCHSEITHEGGGLKVWFFLNDWDWLRGCANLCLEEIRPEEVLLLQKWRKKLWSFSPYVGRPENASIDQVAILKLYPLPKIYIKYWNRKKLPLGRSPISLNAVWNITHSAIASQDSSRVTTTFNAHCTIHCTVEEFNINFVNHDTKSVRYSTVLCAWYHIQ